MSRDLILGIESSCDDTAAAVVDADGKVLSSAIATQLSHWPHGAAVGPPLPSGPTQLSARARMRAVVVLPTPRTPVSMKAWAMRPL